MCHPTTTTDVPMLVVLMESIYLHYIFGVDFLKSKDVSPYQPTTNNHD